MNRISLVAFTFLLGTIHDVASHGRTLAVESEADSSKSDSASILRSAFYLRAAELDVAASPATAAERQLQLRRHFDLVLSTLKSRSEFSLNVALDRLQLGRGELWSADERAAWRHMLAIRRALNIRSLRAYQQRGLFPQSEGHATRAVPIFVDAHDTACAVGHLMRVSGWIAAVDAIEHSNNFVYVTDVTSGPLVDWVLNSGLTQEEAALIQPAYNPPIDAMLNQLIPAGSISHNGLRYENFSFDVVPQQNHFDAASMGVTVRNGDHSFGAPVDPTFDDWILVGAKENADWITYSLGFKRLVIGFEVIAERPDDFIVAASSQTNDWYASNYVAPSAVPTADDEMGIYVDIHPNNDSSRLLFFPVADEKTPYIDARLSTTFAPSKKVQVSMNVVIWNSARFEGLIHSFSIIPEPAGCSLAIVGLASLAGIGRTKRRHGAVTRRSASGFLRH